MKKITAVISAAAIAATMAVPITAGAATEDFVFNFDSTYTQGDAWSVTGGSGTNQEKMETARNATTGKLALQKDAVASTTAYQIQKSAMGLIGGYTLSFNLTIPTAGNVNQFVCELKDNNNSTAIYKTNYFYSSTKSEALVKYNLSGTGDKQLTYTDASGNVRLKGETEYTITIVMNENGQYSITTVPVAGSDFFNKGKMATTINGSFNNYTSTENLRFYCADVSAAPYYIDDIRLIKDYVLTTEASAVTEKVPAEIEGSVTIGDTTVTGVSNDNVVVGDKYISFYKTTVTAGDKAVNGMTIKPAGYTGAAATVNDITAAANGGTASFYTAVINSDGTEITDWKYTFVE